MPAGISTSSGMMKPPDILIFIIKAAPMGALPGARLRGSPGHQAVPATPPWPSIQATPSISSGKTTPRATGRFIIRRAASGVSYQKLGHVIINGRRATRVQRQSETHHSMKEAGMKRMGTMIFALAMFILAQRAFADWSTPRRLTWTPDASDAPAVAVDTT